MLANVNKHYQEDVSPCEGVSEKIWSFIDSPSKRRQADNTYNSSEDHNLSCRCRCLHLCYGPEKAASFWRHRVLISPWAYIIPPWLNCWKRKVLMRTKLTAFWNFCKNSKPSALACCSRSRGYTSRCLLLKGSCTTPASLSLKHKTKLLCPVAVWWACSNNSLS